MVMDSGFNTSHICFQGIDIAATYDFINNVTSVSNQPGDNIVDYLCVERMLNFIR